jgi:pullulanase/glycogen debranching enzyme
MGFPFRAVLVVRPFPVKIEAEQVCLGILRRELFMRNSWQPGKCLPLPTGYSNGVNPSAFSRGGTAVELLFDVVDDPNATRVIQRDPRRSRTSDDWNPFAPGLASGHRYRYRVLAPSTRRTPCDGSRLRTVPFPSLRRIPATALGPTRSVYWTWSRLSIALVCDLVSILSRDQPGCPTRNSPIAYLESGARLAGSRIVAEAWDRNLCQAASLASGNWKEWNGTFREHVRSFMKAPSGRQGF